MIVWKGWGLLALLIPLGLSIGTGLCVDSYYGEKFYQNSTWMMPSIFIVSAVVVFWLGRKVNSQPARILIDPETNEEVKLKTIHSMFWIPLQYWSLILIGVAVWMYAANSKLIY